MMALEASDPIVDMLLLSGDVHLMAAEDDAPPTFSVVAYDGDKMRPSNWPETIVDLSGLDIEAGNRPVLLDHDDQQRVGHTTDVKVTATEIRVEGILSGTGPSAKEVISSARNGFPWRASIGLKVQMREQLGDGMHARINARNVTGPVMLASRSKLMEISFVSIAADNDALVRIAATSNRRSEMDEREKKLFADWLRANGWNPDELNEAQQTSLEAAWRATGGDSSHAIDQPRQPDPEPEPQLTASDPVSHSDDPVCALRAAQAAELERVGQITALFAGEEPDLQLQAVRDGWDVTRAELALLRAQRDRAPAIHTHSSSESAPADVMEAACCAAGGLGDLEDQFSEQVLDAAHARFRHGIGLQDLLLEAAWANGYTGRRMRDDIEGVLRAAFSTLTLPGILSNNANKFLLEGFNYVESAWQQISSTRSVNDFKTHTSYRLTGDMQFIEVGAGGELAHGEVGEDSFTNQAKTYGRMFAITRTDIINDDLGALTAVPRRIGRGAALKLNDVFWTEFMDNSSFFSTGNANYWASATTGPLSSTGLQYAVKLFRKQTDPDGKPVGIEPKILLVPPDIEVEADELFVSTNLNTGGSSSTTKVPNRNVFAAKYRPVVSSYLSNTSYTGYSVVAWYLLADPMDVPVIETAFLNGQQTPTVESADADFNTLGIQMRGYFDFGVSKQEYRGGVKSKGAA